MPKTLKFWLFCRFPERPGGANDHERASERNDHDWGLVPHSISLWHWGMNMKNTWSLNPKNHHFRLLSNSDFDEIASIDGDGGPQHAIGQVSQTQNQESAGSNSTSLPDVECFQSDTETPSPKFLLFRAGRLGNREWQQPRSLATMAFFLTSVSEPMHVSIWLRVSGLISSFR